MKQFLLRKIIIISFFLAISFIIEIVINKTIFQSHCNEALLKLELLPIILIGFLFGFKFSFFFNLLYILIHSILEFAIMEHHFEILGVNIVHHWWLRLGLIFFVFVVPYLAYSISGFFYCHSKKHLMNHQTIVKSLIFISLIQILSYFLFTMMINYFQKESSISFESLSHNVFIELLLTPIQGVAQIIFVYYFASIMITNITLGIILYFLNPVLKENIKFFDMTIYNGISTNKK
ncbi:hypothetical protein [Candidatus Phytoplasma phoenicium]|uniref:Putative integral membrane protein n=1 Tax=Candidatus Phytoplasma phoenicium TaxID=198422 RepID=A0A0L0MJX9_9MOLU|nr:hypothetical protein [Candidatus Phytoplasma phoenicium]KND62590.1 putative integral membrane protein [Candidatus Phytoplasma phoenicium]